MSGSRFELEPQSHLDYYGDSDLLAQVASEIRNNPDSCLTKDILNWYDWTYVQEDTGSCDYRILEPLTIGEITDELVNLANAFGRRDGRQLINSVCRIARRQHVINTAPTVI